MKRKPFVKLTVVHVALYGHFSPLGVTTKGFLLTITIHFEAKGNEERGRYQLGRIFGFDAKFSWLNF